MAIRSILFKVRFYFRVAVLVFAGLILGYGSIYYWPRSSSALEKGVTVTVNRGDAFARVARQLHEQQVVQHQMLFMMYGRIQGADRQIQAGQFHFKGPHSYHKIFKTLLDGHVMMKSVTFYEGMRASRMAGRLRQTFNADSAAFMQWVQDPKYCASLGIRSATLEGYLFPDTYFFTSDMSEKQMIEQMVKRFKTVVQDTMIQKAVEQGMDLHDLLTLASIVEGEAVMAEERPKIAAIYLNRLKRHIPLQACPTIQYIIPDGPRHLLHKDLEIDSPYNTYKYAGLPYGPVNNPGLASILAVIYPDTVNYLYMVAKGDGSHTFSTNLEDHNRAKQRFDRIRRKIRRQKINQR